MAQYIQIGVTATRDRATGSFDPAVPLFVEANSVNTESVRKLQEDLGRLFAARMRMEARESSK